MPKYNVMLFGTMYTGNTKKELADNASVTMSTLNKLLKDNKRRLIYNLSDKTVEVIDIKHDNKYRPLLVQQFSLNHIVKKIITIIDDGVEKEIRLEIPGNKIVNVVMQIKIIYDISEDKDIERTMTRTIYDRPNKKGKGFKVKDLLDIAEEFANEYTNSLPDCENVRVEITKMTGHNDKELFIENMKLRKYKPLKLEGIENVKSINGNCTRNYLLQQYGHVISNRRIKSLGDEEGVTPKELFDFCVQYRIKYCCYDINGNEIIKYIPDNINKNYCKLLIIAYNNHIYPIKNKKIIKTFKHNVLPDDYKITNNVDVVPDIYAHIENILKNGNVPKLFNNDMNIIGACHENKIYVDNSEYKNSLEISYRFNIIDKLKTLASYSSIGSLLSDKYDKKKATLSYFPHSSRFIKAGYLYNNPNINLDVSEYTTIDKNKCYSYALHQLPYLIKIDYMTCTINKHPQCIIEHYMYIAKPSCVTILLPNTNMYAGYHLKYCISEGVDFEILEEITTTKHANFYTQLIADMYDMIDPFIAKTVLNRLIGGFETAENVKSVLELEKIGKGDEIRASRGYCIDIGEYTLVFNEVGKTCTVVTRKPIAVQVKDYARIIMYEKMKDLKLNDSNIKQVKIDSITFVTNSTDQKLTFDNTLYGWKKEKYNPVNNYHYVDDPTLSFYLNIPNNNILVNSYAGCGKSYDIIHNVIPEIKEPFIVLTPSYASLSEYKKNNINCDVIQRFSNNNTVPTEKYIIVDEIGMVDRMGHYMLCKCREMNKQLYLYGDFNQLLPVNETKPLNASHYMNHLALQSKILNQNQRNNFTIEYYDQLINMTRKNAQLNVKKHSHILPTTDEQWDDDLTIICHRNIMVQKYNKYVLQLIDKSKYDIGVKIRCTSNKLIKKNALNNFKYIIIDNDKKSILKIVPHDQKYDNSQIITISYSEYEQNFDVAYALTIYSLQGSFVYKYHFAIEDYAYIDGRMAYTIISRIYEEKNIL